MGLLPVDLICTVRCCSVKLMSEICDRFHGRSTMHAGAFLFSFFYIRSRGLKGLQRWPWIRERLTDNRSASTEPRLESSCSVVTSSCLVAKWIDQDLSQRGVCEFKNEPKATSLGLGMLHLASQLGLQSYRLSETFDQQRQVLSTFLEGAFLLQLETVLGGQSLPTFCSQFLIGTQLGEYVQLLQNKRVWPTIAF